MQRLQNTFILSLLFCFAVLTGYSALAADEFQQVPTVEITDNDGITRKAITELPDELKSIGLRMETLEFTDNPGKFVYKITFPSLELPGYYSIRNFKVEDKSTTDNAANGEEPQFKEVEKVGYFNRIKYSVDENGVPKDIYIENSVGESVVLIYDADAKKVYHAEDQWFDDYGQPNLHPTEKASDGGALFKPVTVSEGVSPYFPFGDPGAVYYEGFLTSNADSRNRPADSPVQSATPYWKLDAYNPDLDILRLVSVDDANSGHLDVNLELPSSISAWALNDDILAMEASEDCNIAMAPLFEKETNANNQIMFNLANFLNQEDPTLGNYADYVSTTKLDKAVTASGIGASSLQRMMDIVMVDYHRCVINKQKEAGVEDPNSDGYVVFTSSTGKSDLLINTETGRVLSGSAWNNDVEIGEIDANNSLVITEFGREVLAEATAEAPAKIKKIARDYIVTLDPDQKTYSAAGQEARAAE